MMKMRMAVRWENLPSDIIETISDRLFNGTDYISFRSVCTSWRAATKKKHNIPFLIVPGAISRNIHSVLRVSDLETRMIIIRQEVLGMKCCGASHGYLIMVHPKNRDVVLWNPINTHIIPVPPLITGWRIPNNGQGGGFPNPPTLRQASMKTLNVHKAILTSNPYNHRESDVYLFAIFNRQSKSSKMAYHKVGSDRWMVLVHGSYFKDVIFACNYVCAIDGLWNIYICNIHNETTVMVTKVTIVNAPMNFDHLYLVEVNCQLWAALRYKYPDPENSEEKKGEFRFVAIRRVSQMNHVGIEEVTDLEGRAFFFGMNQSFWMSTEEHTQLMQNCVYYTNFPLKRDDDVYGHQDFGIYDTVKCSIERVPGCSLEYPLTWAPSAWLMPYRNNIEGGGRNLRLEAARGLVKRGFKFTRDILPQRIGRDEEPNDNLLQEGTS